MEGNVLVKSKSLVKVIDTLTFETKSTHDADLMECSVTLIQDAPRCTECSPRCSPRSKVILSFLGIISIIFVIIVGSFFLNDSNGKSKTEKTGRISLADDVPSCNYDTANCIDIDKQQQHCGKQQSYSSMQFALDSNATPPWYVSIWMTNGKDYSFNCGATLVDNWIISSAHCFVPDREYLENRSVQTDAAIELEPFLDRLVLFGNQMVFDPDIDLSRLFQLDTPMYLPINHNKYENDLIAIKMPKGVPVDYIVPLCSHSSYNWDATCWISGPRLEPGSTPNGHVRSHLVWLQDCSERMLNLSSINEWSVCAGREGVESCRGDSGGPLACYNADEKVWEAIGIISWSNGACMQDTPKTDVHTKLHNIKLWLDKLEY